MYDSENIFAKILRGDIPNNTVHEDSDVLAFADIQPQKPVHVLVIPKGEYVSFDDFSSKAGAEAVGRFFEKVGMIAREKLNLSSNGYRLVTNIGNHGGQEVPHFHVHILAGEPVGALVAQAA